MALTNQYRLAVAVAVSPVPTLLGRIQSLCEFCKSDMSQIAVLAGFSIGWTQLTTLVSCGLVVPVHDIGIGQGFFGSCRNIIGTIATSIFVSINGNRVSQTMASNVPPAVINAGLPASSVPLLFQAAKNGTTAAIQSVPGITPTIIAAFSRAQRDSYSQSFQTVYYVSIAFGSLAIIASYWAPNVDSLLTGFLNKRVDGVKTTSVMEEEVNDRKRDGAA